MTTNNADFKVKKGLVVADGDVTLASDHSVKAGIFDTNVAAAGVTLTAVTLSADGTDTNIPINITPKGSGSVVMSKVDINGGTIDATDITVGSGKTLNVSGGTLTLAADQISGDAINGGTIGSITITALAGDLSLGDNNITNVGQISLDAIGPDADDMDIKLSNNQAAALDILQGSDSYMKFVTTTDSESIILSPEPNQYGVCKVVIGDNAAEDTMLVFDGAEIEYRLGIDDSANQFEIGVGEAHDTTAAIVMDNAGHIVQLGQSTPSDGQVLAWDNSNGRWSPTASASGADGMGSGFTVSATTDSNATTITQGDDLFFAATGGLTATTTADGTVTHALDINGLTAAAIASGDLLAFADISHAGNATRKETVADLATLFAGTGLTASSAVIGVDAAQTQITSVGALTALSTAADSTIDLNGGAITVDGTTLSIDSTDTTNLTMTANSSSAKAMTIDAANSGSGAASILIGTTSGTAISIGNTTSETTINDNLTVTGDLTVNGTTTTVNSTTIQLDDKNIELANGVGNDAAIDGGGITLISSGDNKTFNYVNANTAWTSSENFDIVSGKKYKLGGADIFTNATTLASGVVTSSLTTVGALNSGSITSGFGSINNGSSAITTTGTITGGVLVADNLQLDGNVLSSTNSNGNIALTPNGTGLVNIAKDDLAIAGVAVTTTAAELNVLDAVTAGTVSASLALVVDSNKDLATIRNLTSNGTVQAAAVSVDAVAVLDTTRGSGASISGATAITSFATGTYTTAKYIYQIKKDTAVDTDVGEILITYEGTSDDVFILEYGMISTGTSIGAWSADFNSNSVRLIYTPANNGNHTYTILNTLLI